MEAALRESLILEMAKLLCLIHGHCLPPFYCREDWRDNTGKDFHFGWDTLPEVTSIEAEVDRTFFKEIANYLIDKLAIEEASSAASGRTFSMKSSREDFTKVIFAINHFNLQPFYPAIEESAEEVWASMPETEENDFGRVGFRRVADHILQVLNIEPAK
jgi:hypothetical protein